MPPPPSTFDSSIPASSFPVSRIGHRRSLQDFTSFSRAAQGLGSAGPGHGGSGRPNSAGSVGAFSGLTPSFSSSSLASLDAGGQDGVHASVADAYASIVDVYDLLYPDWKGSIRRGARLLHALIVNLLTDTPLKPPPSMNQSTPAAPPSALASAASALLPSFNLTSSTSATTTSPSIAPTLSSRPVSFSSLAVLDASCGIGTQALGLASLGCHLSASDVCAAAVDRCRREAADRSLTNLEYRVADMRDLRPDMFRNAEPRDPAEDEAAGVSAPAGVDRKERGFDVVLSLGDSVPHFLTRRDMVTALTALYECLRPGGIVLVAFTDRSASKTGGSQMSQIKTGGIRPVRSSTVSNPSATPVQPPPPVTPIPPASPDPTAADGVPFASHPPVSPTLSVSELVSPSRPLRRRYIVWQVWDWVRPQRRPPRPTVPTQGSSGSLGGWLKPAEGVVGRVTGGILGGSGPAHYVEVDNRAGDEGVVSSGMGGGGGAAGADDDTETSEADGGASGTKGAIGTEDDEDAVDDDGWLPQDDDPMGWRAPEVRDAAWLAPNGLAPTADRGSLRARTRQASVPLATQGLGLSIAGLAKPLMGGGEAMTAEPPQTTVSIPMVDLQVSLYDLSLYFLEDDGVSTKANAKVMRTRCRAWSCTEVLGLMQEVGFVHVGRAPDEAYSQPLLYGYKAL
ncbi:hypothetical protein HDU96_000483 [Phlyctochytrium bullatum]|nr:hypothetical protein HDU96_000483 [Phlyctochytrium bullatum]